MEQRPLCNLAIAFVVGRAPVHGDCCLHILDLCRPKVRALFFSFAQYGKHQLWR